MSTKDRGFASMKRDRQREIASLGGKAAHRKGTAHQWTSEQAREAGRKGGLASRGGRGKTIAAPAAEYDRLPVSDASVGNDVPGGGAI